LINYNTTEYELYNSNYGMQIDTPATSVTATFWFNGTAKTATTENVGGNTWNINSTFLLTNSDIKNNSLFFEINANDLKHNTTLNSQWINGTIFDQCNSTLTSPYINFTYTNETIAQESITAFVSSSTWNYYGDDITEFKTMTFSNATENNWTAFCIEPSSKTLKTNVTFSYSNSLSEQRTYEQSSLTLTNTTLNQQLFLLPSSEGIFVTFQVVDAADQVLSGVSANVTRNGFLVGSGITNDAGIVVFFLDPDTSYTFIFFKESFTTFTTTLIPTQTTFTINLGTESIPKEDFTIGMVYSIDPKQGTTLSNDTDVQFSFTLSSSFWTVTSYGFVLYNSSGATLGTASQSANGGTVSTTINTNSLDKINMNFFWEINGNITNGTSEWTIFDSTGRGFGLNNFFNRLKTYLEDGIFGLTPFGLSLIVFLIIFTIAGIMSFKFGVADKRIIAGVTFGLVLLFDIGLNLIPRQGLATVMVGILNLAAWYNEGIR